MDLCGIDFPGIGRVIRRGSGETVEETDGAILVRDSVSGANFPGCADAEAITEAEITVMETES